MGISTRILKENSGHNLIEISTYKLWRILNREFSWKSQTIFVENFSRILSKDIFRVSQKIKIETKIINSQREFSWKSPIIFVEIFSRFLGRDLYSVSQNKKVEIMIINFLREFSLFSQMREFSLISLLKKLSSW